ncbi:MAG: PAS domain-containing protein, partial [Myxococcales bacterium]|nr:PAS domain-containing protein [Myxococcales bacterium]
MQAERASPGADSALLAVFLSGVTNVSAVFLVALLAGYLSEQLRDAGRRLKVASRDLESARAINERIIQSIQSGLVAYTLEEDDIIFFNPAAARITGFDAAAVLYTPVHAVFQKLPAGEDPLARWEADFTRPD